MSDETAPRRETHRMTLRVYRVAAGTGRRTPVRSVTVLEKGPWLGPPGGFSPGAYPPCECPEHRRE
ncbi:hypothetical protein MMF93_16280 [Streptomyces tubbatahanensis]|uniref:Uncharacterized protein n=1 Tax=Streptomyces tubbatahanensis TaxID=2923272 RepID=A0ABY3XTP2_9ACTN|nr:hypothetical protein [Streptomyces tubbatahanensis]UNS97856.1 hypothetical protein MMF93_16280 [Streptomyces tubbatahanensis]